MLLYRMALEKHTLRLLEWLASASPDHCHRHSSNWPPLGRVASFGLAGSDWWWLAHSENSPSIALDWPDTRPRFHQLRDSGAGGLPGSGFARLVNSANIGGLGLSPDLMSSFQPNADLGDEKNSLVFRGVPDPGHFHLVEKRGVRLKGGHGTWPHAKVL